MAARVGGAPCGACKFLRRKCVEGCVFAPYFVTEELGAAHFAAIHKVFGASNFSKLLHNIQSEEERFDAVVSVAYEAQARLHDPIYGCVSHIFALQQQVAHLQGELVSAYSKLAGSSDGTLMSPSHVNRKQGEIQLSFVNNAYVHYNSLNEPQTSHQRILENTMTSSDDKDSCFPTQPLNVPQENITSMEGSLDDIGDLEALVCSLLRKNTSSKTC